MPAVFSHPANCSVYLLVGACSGPELIRCPLRTEALRRLHVSNVLSCDADQRNQRDSCALFYCLPGPKFPVIGGMLFRAGSTDRFSRRPPHAGLCQTCVIWPSAPEDPRFILSSGLFGSSQSHDDRRSDGALDILCNGGRIFAWGKSTGVLAPR